MPFQAKYDGQVVWPDEVTKQDSLICLGCGDTLHIVVDHPRADGSHVARHFRHSPDSSVAAHCHGGESNTHKMMKYVATRKLYHDFPNCDVAREKAVPGTDRVADVLVDFGGESEKLGKGVIAECQHKNRDKDIEAVTQDYTQAGFSVYWLNSSHFSKDFRSVELPMAATVWPHAVPIPYRWRGVDRYWEQLGQSSPSPRIEVEFPEEMLDEQEPWLKERWEMAAGTWSKQDLLRFTDHVDESKTCMICNYQADFLFWRDGLHGSFRCRRHLPGEVTWKDLERNYNRTIDLSEGEGANP